MRLWNQEELIGRARSLIRFLLWFALTVHAVMLAVFSVMFLFQLLRFTWHWTNRVLFSQPW